jgi:hypothetical protein
MHKIPKKKANIRVLSGDTFILACLFMIMTFSSSSSSSRTLHAAWVEHDSNASADRLWGKVASKSASNHTIGSMGSCDLAPVYTVVSVLAFRDKGNLFAEVKFRCFLVIAALDLDETHSIFLVAQSSLIAEDSSIDMQARRSFLCYSCHG